MFRTALSAFAILITSVAFAQPIGPSPEEVRDCAKTYSEDRDCLRRIGEAEAGKISRGGTRSDVFTDAAVELAKRGRIGAAARLFPLTFDADE